MSDRGDVTIELYVERDRLDGVLASISSATNDEVQPEDFGVAGDNKLVFAETEWLDVQNSDGNTDAWFQEIIKIDGLVGLEIRNSLSHGVETWRWTMALGPWRGTLDYEQGDVISLDDVMAAFEQARHEAPTAQLDEAWRAIAATFGYSWISALQGMALFVKRPLDEQ